MLDVKSDTDANLVTLKATNSDPELAAKIANAWARFSTRMCSKFMAKALTRSPPLR